MSIAKDHLSSSGALLIGDAYPGNAGVYQCSAYNAFLDRSVPLPGGVRLTVESAQRNTFDSSITNLYCKMRFRLRVPSKFKPIESKSEDQSENPIQSDHKLLGRFRWLQINTAFWVYTLKQSYTTAKLHVLYCTRDR